MELRTLTAEDAPAIDKLMSEAFSRGVRPEPQAETAEEKPEISIVRLGVFEGPRLVACAIVNPLTLAWGSHDAPLGGIGGVACTADQRGRGHVGHLLSASLRGMRDAGQYLSGLFPFSFSFYRRHGWDWVGEQRQYTVPTSELKAGPEGRCLTMYEGMDALQVVRPVYEQFARRYHGMGLRPETAPGDTASYWWKRTLGSSGSRTLYVQVYTSPVTGHPEGYLVFLYPDGSDPGQVGDFCANTPAAYRGLLSVLHYYGVQVEKVSVSAPMDDPLALHLMHWDLETKIKPLFMGRVVDVPAALTALRPETDWAGKIVLQVSDPQCDWNSQTFAVTVDAGHVTAQPSQDTPGVALDIQTLSQAYWGQPSLDRLRAAERLSISDESQYALLSRLLPPRICFFKDFF